MTRTPRPRDPERIGLDAASPTDAKRHHRPVDDRWRILPYSSRCSHRVIDVMLDDSPAGAGKSPDDLAFERINADRQSASEYYRAASQYLILINGVTTSAVIAYLTGNIKDIAKIGGFLFLLICLSVVFFTTSVIVAGIFTYFRMQAYDQWANWWEMKLRKDDKETTSAQFEHAVHKSNVSDKLFLSSIMFFVLGTSFFIVSVVYQGQHQPAASADREIVIKISLPH